MVFSNSSRALWLKLTFLNEIRQTRFCGSLMKESIIPQMSSP